MSTITGLYPYEMEVNKPKDAEWVCLCRSHKPSSADGDSLFGSQSKENKEHTCILTLFASQSQDKTVNLSETAQRLKNFEMQQNLRYKRWKWQQQTGRTLELPRLPSRMRKCIRNNHGKISQRFIQGISAKWLDISTICTLQCREININTIIRSDQGGWQHSSACRVWLAMSWDKEMVAVQRIQPLFGFISARLKIRHESEYNEHIWISQPQYNAEGWKNEEKTAWTNSVIYFWLRAVCSTAVSGHGNSGMM